MLMAVAIQFAPELSAQNRSLGTSALWIAAMFWNYATAPKIDLGERPPQIIWDERDEGEKFTIVMFHLVLLGVAMLIAYAMVDVANSPEGHWWMNFPAAMVVGSSLWLIWNNWNDRNAR
jgi:hypothetical protein